MSNKADLVCFPRLSSTSSERARGQTGSAAVQHHQKGYWSVTIIKWITRERVKVDRVACPWLIRKFVDKHAEFFFVPGDSIVDEAQRLGAIPFDVKGVELGHHGPECLFEAILKKYNLDDEPYTDKS